MPAALQHSRPSHAHAPQRRAHSVIYSRRLLLFIHGREMGLLVGRCSEEASVRAFGPVVGVRPCSVQPRLLLLDHERVEETALDEYAVLQLTSDIQRLHLYVNMKCVCISFVYVCHPIKT